MRIAVVSPLYPPDIAPAAKYAKELAARLSKHHAVTLLVYGSIPEKIPGVEIQVVQKRLPVLFRLMRFSYALGTLSLRTDQLFVVNGASTEVPAILVYALTGKKYTACLADMPAQNMRNESAFLKKMHALYISASERIVRDIPPNRPEILPFSKGPDALFEEYEYAWERHLKELGV